jgi:hypothetical protein
MKRFGWIFTVLLATLPAWSAQNITVEQLRQLLTTDQQAKKTDGDVANDLKQVVLTEELTTPAINSFAPLVPGAATLEQIYVLEAKSAVLAPPASDIPATPAPDAAAQKALLDKAMDYASKTYAQLPTVTATKTTTRFQDSVSAIAAFPGKNSGAADASTDPKVASAAQSIRAINAAPTPVNIHNGIEENPLAKDKTPWGSNGYIALLGQSPVLSTVLQEANAAEKFAWLRWENLNGKTAGVFSFAVDKKKSHYAVNYCCFPERDQDGNTSAWYNYKATIPYHGEIFVDPDTGIVVRLITESEFKTSDVVRQEDQRIDYLPVAIGGKTLVLPSKSIVNTEVVPTGDTGGGKSTIRHTLFTSDYKGYQAGS